MLTSRYSMKMRDTATRHTDTNATHKAGPKATGPTATGYKIVIRYVQ